MIKSVTLNFALARRILCTALSIFLLIGAAPTGQTIEADKEAGLYEQEDAERSLRSSPYYRLLKEDVKKVASGDVTVTQFTYDAKELGFRRTSWTLQELGVSRASNLTGAEVEEKVSEQVDMDLLLSSLRFDCPYDLYWFDSAGEGISYHYEMTADYVGGEMRVSLGKFTFNMAVAGEYQKSKYETDAAKITEANEAAKKAKAIVAENEGKSDLEKLNAYRAAICDLASYNFDILRESDPDYGNPWQVIWVFDEDPDTKVVCEGYAKAFQYLCDLSSFSGDVVCRLVTGTMNGGTGEGHHMWNMVTIDGETYLADITNCDSGTIGFPEKLFLICPAESLEEGCTFRISGRDVSYIYDEDTRKVYGLEQKTDAITNES